MCPFKLDHLIGLLMELYKKNPSSDHSTTALEASERSRARSLLDLLTEAHADIRQGVDQALVTRERSLQQRLNGKATALYQLLNKPHTEVQAAQFKKEIDEITTELQQVQTQIRQSSPRYADLTQPQPLSLVEIQQQVLDQGSLLLEYSLGQERSYLWAVTPTTIKAYELLTVEAAVHGDRDAAYQALLVHPIGPKADKVQEVLDDMLQTHREHLPQFFK